MKNLVMIISFVTLILLITWSIHMKEVSADEVYKSILIIGIALGTLLPIIAALMLFMNLVFNIFKDLIYRFAKIVAINKQLEDTIASYFYFIIDMAPSISSVSIVAIFVTTEASKEKLVIMFIFGMIMKYVARRFLNAYYDLIRGIQGRKNDRNDNKSSNRCTSTLISRNHCNGTKKYRATKGK